MVLKITLLLQQSEHRPHGRIARRVGQVLHHFHRRRLRPSVNYVHDLALAAAQIRVRMLCHLRLPLRGQAQRANFLAC
jgi:hypothetical protein